MQLTEIFKQSVGKINANSEKVTQFHPNETSHYLRSASLFKLFANRKITIVDDKYEVLFWIHSPNPPIMIILVDHTVLFTVNEHFKFSFHDASSRFATFWSQKLSSYKHCSHETLLTLGQRSNNRSLHLLMNKKTLFQDVEDHEISTKWDFSGISFDHWNSHDFKCASPFNLFTNRKITNVDDTDEIFSKSTLQRLSMKILLVDKTPIFYAILRELWFPLSWSNQPLWHVLESRTFIAYRPIHNSHKALWTRRSEIKQWIFCDGYVEVNIDRPYRDGERFFKNWVGNDGYGRIQFVFMIKSNKPYP